MPENSLKAIAILGALLVLSKRERLDEILCRLRDHAPFSTGREALSALKAIMRDVEDRHSGVVENPNAAQGLTTDGRMYPPDEHFRKPTGSPSVSRYRQRAHETWIGANGAMRIASVQGDVLLDKPGSDSRTIANVLEESK